jgi:threonine dehydratase
VEAALYPVVLERAQRRRTVRFGGPTLAEGIAVKNVGALTLPIVRELVPRILLVDEAHLECAVNAYLTLQKTMAEGAGAAGLAPCWPGRTGSAAARSGSSCAAATSIRAFSPR